MTKKAAQTLNGIQELRDAVESRIASESAVVQGSSASDNYDYWEQSVGSDLVDEVLTVYKTLLADDDALERILVARKYHVTESVDLVLEQVRFQLKYRPHSIDPLSISNALASGTWRLCGYSREGCVVSNYKLELWDPNAYGMGAGNSDQILEDAVEEYVRYVVYMIELMIGRMHSSPVPQQFVVLFDLRGFKTSMVFRSNVKLMIRKLIYVAQAQYPERLRKVLLVNAPFGFETAWKLIRSLLDEKTASKIHFVDENKIVADIAPEVLSDEYGGSHLGYPIPSKSLKEEINSN